MNVHWMLETRGDPLGRLLQFIDAIWREAALDAMLVPRNGASGVGMAPALIWNRARLNEVNPFRPLMMENNARHLPALLREYRDQRLGAVLRPCEVRALVEMCKHDGVQPDDLLLLGVDCLATFDADDYAWRAERKRNGKRLSDEALQFARQGGIVPYRYRPACQICYSPQATMADLNIGVLGLPARRAILVTARDEPTAERLNLDHNTDGVAPPDLLAQHERMVAKLEMRRRQARERLDANLKSLLPDSVEALVNRFVDCEECQRCLEACPICAVDFPQRDEDGRYLSQDISRWLVSCAGCGMCEQVCPQGQPLSAIFGHIRAQLLDESDYVPGRAFTEPLPSGVLSDTVQGDTIAKA